MTGRAASSHAGVHTFRYKLSSLECAALLPSMRAIGVSAWADSEPKRVASRTPSQPASRTGGRNRRAPTGGAANGMPRNTRIPSRSIPSTFPLRVAAIVIRARLGGGAERSEVGLALFEERRERLEVGGPAHHVGEGAVFAGTSGADCIEAS